MSWVKRQEGMRKEREREVDLRMSTKAAVYSMTCRKHELEKEAMEGEKKEEGCVCVCVCLCVCC